MKTKILGIVTMVTVLLAMLVTSANAATMTADKTEMQKEEIVTITVTTEQEVASMQFDIAFDSSKYEYVVDSAESELANTASRVISDGVVRVSAFESGNATNTLTLKFKAIDNGENVPFTISNTEFVAGSDVTGETFDADTINVTIAEVEEPENPDDDKPAEDPDDKPAEDPDDNKPAEDPDKKPTEDPDDNNGSDYVDENGNPIDKLPQTGSIVPAIIAGVAILLVASLVVFKATRK